MKKIISLLIIISVICAGYFFIHAGKGNDIVYYTKITNEGKKSINKVKNGNSETSYQYTLVSANEQGTIKTISFNTAKYDKPLKMNTYLLLKYNSKKGVLGWREVPKKEVPVKTLAKLDKK